MLTETQVKLCARYADHGLTEMAPPGWFVEHVSRMNAGQGDRNASLALAGATLIADVDGLQSMDVFKSPNGYFAEYKEDGEPAIWIFIDRPIDYIGFRTKILGPLEYLAQRAEEKASNKAPARKRTPRR